MLPVVSRLTIMNNRQPGKGKPRATAPPLQSLVQGQDLFVGALPVIRSIARWVCYRYHLTGADTQDFKSDVEFHFLKNDCAALRKFDGESDLSTYVNVIVQHLAIDYLSREFGRWRPSPEAKRLGFAAILLERYVKREGMTIEQALETLRVNHGVALHPALREFCVTLARRQPVPQRVTEDAAGDVPSQAPSPDADLLRAEQEALARRTRAALERARWSLKPEERLILKMRFESDMSVADIARALNQNQKQLYRRIKQLFERLRTSLEAGGVSQRDVVSLLEDGTLTRNPGSDPSDDDGPPPEDPA
jgi:RNA polymerase sigma factor (sigma-70 family)